jgi:hypothetical protein
VASFPRRVRQHLQPPYLAWAGMAPCGTSRKAPTPSTALPALITELIRPPQRSRP